ncbi:MAG: putative toxin-antitoxin system toxin component, PIN family [Planctomycetes bacterium]|nr:putative toxin-antitoxin system toxin component, PIN family [Planctomycetota bacterium]
MRIVFDTNVLLAGVFTRGVCEALLDVCLNSRAHVVVASEYILNEFVRQSQAKFVAPIEDVRLVLQSFRVQIELVEPALVDAGACRDKDDLPILGTLLAGRADCLVTGDKDLLVLKKFRGIEILSPRMLYKRLQ